MFYDSRLASRRICATIIHASSDAIVGLTPKGIVTSWNPGAERAYGHSALEMIGQSFFTVVPSDLHGVEMRLLARAVAGTPVGNADTERWHADGSRRIVRRSLLFIEDDQLRDLCDSRLISIERDVTLLRALERQALKVSGDVVMPAGVSPPRE